MKAGTGGEPRSVAEPRQPESTGTTAERHLIEVVGEIVGEILRARRTREVEDA